MRFISLAFATMIVLYWIHECDAAQITKAVPFQPDSVRTLDEVIITASGIPTLTDETLKPAIVISQREIERNSGTGLSGLLHRQSGFFMSNAYAAPAENRRLKLQGAGDAYTIIMLDGAVLGDPSSVSSLFDMRLISLADIRRIEIVKGSQSTLYGSDAIGGVIHLFSKLPDKYEKVAGEVSVAADSYLGRELTLGMSGYTAHKISYTIRYSGEGTEGFSAASATDDQNFDKDGFLSHSFNGNVMYDIPNAGNVHLSLQQGWYKGDFDGGAFQDAPNVYDAQKTHMGLRYLQTFGRTEWKLSHNATFSNRSFDILNSFTNEMDTFDYQGGQHQLQTSLQTDALSFMKLVVGSDVTFYGVPSDADRPSSSASILSGYANSVSDLHPNIWLEAGLRINRHSSFGTTWTYSTAAALQASTGLKITAGTSTGYKAPTLDQLYGLFGANPTLEPQKSRYHYVETMFSSEETGISVRAQLFQRNTRELIQYDFQQGYLNRSREEVWGIDAGLSWDLSTTIQLNFNYNFMKGALFNPSDIGEVRDELFVLIPEHRWTSSLLWNPLEMWFFRFDIDASSSRTDLYYDPETFTTSRVSLDAYQLLNIFGEYRVERLTVYMHLRNLMDDAITEIFGYNSMKRNIKIGVRYSW